MPSNRIGRINEEIQRELSSLLRTIKDPRVADAGMLSVTAVETTPDLKYAKIYVSVLDKSASAQALKGLKSASGYLRRELGRALNLRNTPELSFETPGGSRLRTRLTMARRCSMSMSIPALMARSSSICVSVRVR